jgi:hypothetical protein
MELEDVCYELIKSKHKSYARCEAWDIYKNQSIIHFVHIPCIVLHMYTPSYSSTALASVATLPLSMVDAV